MIMSFGNPETSAQYNLDRRNRGDDIEKTGKFLLPLHAACAEKLKKIAIRPEDFSDLYSRKSIQDDAQYVERRKREFNSRSHEKMASHGNLTNGEVKQISEILEYQIIKGINVDGWIPYVSAVKTADEDDIGRGVDAVLEFSKDAIAGQAGLSIDVSFSHDLGNKFGRIKKDIDEFDDENNRLAVIKYFKSKQSGFRGELSGIPRVVVALDLGVMEDLARHKETKDHIAKHIVISEITQQLAVFRKYAERVNPRCVPALDRAKRFMEIIQTHLRTEQTLEQSEYIKNRRINAAIERNLDIFR
jgi:hypothetical protein